MNDNIVSEIVRGFLSVFYMCICLLVGYFLTLTVCNVLNLEMNLVSIMLCSILAMMVMSYTYQTMKKD